jgi:hypothetical protein
MVTSPWFHVKVHHLLMTSTQGRWTWWAALHAKLSAPRVHRVHLRLTNCFRIIPERILKDDDQNLVRSIVNRSWATGMLRDHGWTWGVSLVHKHGESLKQIGIWLPKVWIDTSQRWGCLKLVDLYDTHIMRNYPKKPGIITISVQFFSFQIGIPT